MRINALRRVAGPLQALALALVTTATVVAQQAGSIAGAVADTKGTGIPHATIVLRNETTNAVTKIAGDDVGQFNSPVLATGSYTVEASAPGFALGTKKAVAVTAEHGAQVGMTLNIGSVTDQITVEASNSNSVAAQYAPMDGLWRRGARARR